MPIDDDTLDVGGESATVRAVVEKISGLIQQLTPPDHEPLHQPLQHLQKALELTRLRLEQARDALENANGRATGSSAATFKQVLKTFRDKLLELVEKPLVYHVVGHKLQLVQLEKLHSGTDGLDAVFPEAWKERDAFNAALAEYAEELGPAIDQCVHGFKRDIVANWQRVLDCLQELQAAKESKNSYRWSENDLAKGMETKIKPLESEATEMKRVYKRPEWFIPQDHVVWDPERLAKGSFGNIFSGRWSASIKETNRGTLVVIKMLNVKAEKQNAFANEVEVWSKLNHVHVCRLWGACHLASPPFMVCEEAIKNGNLKDYLSPPSNKNQTWRLLYQTALGLEYMHGKNIIHGDLKLNNVLVSENGTARLTDFGISRIKRSSNVYATDARPDVQTAGALRWRAPECVSDSDAHASNPQLASDIYSLGMCVFEAFAGKAPYAHVDDHSARELIAKGQLPDKPRSMPDDAWEVVKSLAQLDLTKRPKIGEVLVMLDTFVKKEEDAANKAALVDENTAIGQVKHHKTPKNHDDAFDPKTNKTPSDLERLVQSLMSRSDDQRLRAATALTTYAEESIQHQQEVHDARAISALVRILKDNNESIEVQKQALLALGVVVLGNKAAQQQAVDDSVLPCLVQLLDGELRGIAALVLSYLGYNNSDIKAEIHETGAVEKIAQWQDVFAEDRNMQDHALTILRISERRAGQSGP